jgi:hypothetical protein
VKNRAKCKLCESIIESFFEQDYVSCKCGEITVYGGLSMRCAFINQENFLRVDDEGNIVVPHYVESKDAETDNQTNDQPKEQPAKEEVMKMLDEMIESYEKLPQHGMSAPVTHYDFMSLLIILKVILK